MRSGRDPSTPLEVRGAPLAVTLPDVSGRRAGVEPGWALQEGRQNGTLRAPRPPRIISMHYVQQHAE